MSSGTDSDDEAGGSQSHARTRGQTQREKEESQWQPIDPPELTIENSTEGEDWASEEHEIHATQNEAGALTPLTALQIQANLYVLKKRNARFKYTVATNVMLKNLQEAKRNPGSHGSDSMLLQGMEALKIKLGQLEAVESEGFHFPPLLAASILKRDEATIKKGTREMNC
jgi:hypothetical protein